MKLTLLLISISLCIIVSNCTVVGASIGARIDYNAYTNLDKEKETLLTLSGD